MICSDVGNKHIHSYRWHKRITDGCVSLWPLMMHVMLTKDRFVVVQPGKLLPSAHAIEREYHVMKALEGSGVPVPHMISLCEDVR